MRNRRLRRVVVIFILAAIPLAGALYESFKPAPTYTNVSSENSVTSEKALVKLGQLEIKGRSPKTDYSRAQFGDGWGEIQGCDTRNWILRRDLTETLIGNNCRALSGKLNDPYTGQIIEFKRGESTSQAVQIDHVVALSDAWQKGAQYFDPEIRLKIANDPLNLLAVDGPANQKKGDGDAATWLPPNKGYRCAYVARQIAVKAKYKLWVTKAESDAMKRVLYSCPSQQLPMVKGP